MDMTTLGAALNGAKTYVNSHFKGGANINIVDNPDGTQTINASGEVSAEDTVAREAIAEIRDGEDLDSFADVELALDGKQDTVSDLSSIRSGATAGATAIQGVKVNDASVTPDANKVISITVPTTASDVDALPDTVKYATAISLTINPSTFIITAQLKDQDNNNLGSAQTIDLPFESVVVNGSYNNQTKKVVLTLQNGSTIEFSVADLVAGLQTELSASNKLNPAFINYDSTHAAITEAQVAQIETNKSNILLTYNQNGQTFNLLSHDYTSKSINNLSITVNADKSISVSGTSNAQTSERIIDNYQLPAGTYYLVDGLSNASSNLNLTLAINGTWAGTTAQGKFEFTVSQGDLVRVSLYVNNNTATNVTFKPMIVDKSLYDAGFTSYQPYSLPNTKITPALVEAVDSGGKNMIVPEVVSSTESITITSNADGSYILNGTTGSSVTNIRIGTVTMKAGTYVLSGCASGGSGGTWLLRLYGETTITNISPTEGNEFTTGEYTAYIDIVIGANKTLTNAVFKPMVCTLAEWQASNQYVAPSPKLNELSKLRTYRQTTNATTYKFAHLDGLSNTGKFKYALLVGGGTASAPEDALLWMVFISTNGAVTITKVFGSGTQTLTGTVTNDNLTITASATIYGGLRLIWLG